MQKHFDVSCPFFSENFDLLLGEEVRNEGGLKWEVPSSKGNMPCFQADERRAGNSSASVDSQLPSAQNNTYAKVACFRVACLVPVMRLIVDGSSIDVTFLPIQPSLHCPHSFLLTSFSLGSDNVLNVLVWFPHFLWSDFSDIESYPSYPTCVHK